MHGPATTPAGGPALLERAVGYALGNLALVPGHALRRSTPCAGWDLRALLGHLADSLTALREAADARYVEPSPHDDPEPRPETAVAAVRERAVELLGAWATVPERAAMSIGEARLPLHTAAEAGALEVAVHGWDVARTCGVDRPLPSRLAMELLYRAPELVDAADRPTRFAEPVPVLPHAGPSDRLLAFLGRDAAPPKVTRTGKGPGHP